MSQTAYVRVIESDNLLDFSKRNSHFIKMKIQQFFVKQTCLELPKFTGWHTPTKFLMTESLKRDLLDLDLQYLPISGRCSQEMYFFILLNQWNTPIISLMTQLQFDVCFMYRILN